MEVKEKWWNIPRNTLCL